MTVHVGTSGWAYPSWKGTFYPDKLAQARFLEHYATRLSACEINNTYHRMPEVSMVQKWADTVPEDFRFAVKGFRGLTPRNPSLDMLQDFLTKLEPLGKRLGVVMFQFILKRDGNEEAMLRFLDAIPDHLPVALDMKHQSWEDFELPERMTRCYTDREGDPPAELPAGEVAYVRLRAGRYSDAQRNAWKRKLSGAGRDAFLFVKHEDTASDDHEGVLLAEWLAQKTA
jgi:uncharacterized protein YecE (DUF72 family)